MRSPRVNFRLPEETLQKVDLLVENGIFDDRSQFFRVATEQLLRRSMKKIAEEAKKR